MKCTRPLDDANQRDSNGLSDRSGVTSTCIVPTRLVDDQVISPGDSAPGGGGGGCDCPSPAGVCLPESGERGEVVDAVQAPAPELVGGEDTVDPDEVHGGPPDQLGIAWSVPDEENPVGRQAVLLD
jgi:hypothetical protein